MKKIIKIGISLLLITVVFVSCNTTDPVNLDRSVKPTVNLKASTVSVIEGSSSAITIETSAITSNDIIFSLVQVGGNAVEGVDYEFASADMSAPDYGAVGGRVVIPAYATTGSVNINGLLDLESDSKSATFELRSIQSMLGVVGGTSKVTVNIENFTTAYIDISFAWDKDIVIPGIGTYNTDANVDLDIFVADAAGYDNNNPWGTFNGTDYAATGDHPEVLRMDPSDWGDGEFILFTDLWDNGFFGLGLTDKVPVTTTITRWGAFANTFVQDPSQAADLSMEGAATGPGFGGFIAKVKILNGVFTIYDFNDAQIASGKMPNKTRTPRPLNLRK